MKEEWKDVKGYEKLYMVSSLGRVKSLDRKVKTKNGNYQTYYGEIKKISLSTTGYYRVNLHKDNKLKTFKVHNLMAVAFLNYRKNGLKYVVDHIDNNPLNNKLSNLQVITTRENCSKDKKNGTSKYTGVSRQKEKWVTSIQIKGKDLYLGRYSCEETAAKAYTLAVENGALFNGNQKEFRNLIKSML